MGKLVDADTNTFIKARRGPASPNHFPVSDKPEEVARHLTKLNDRITTLEGNGVLQWIEFDITCPYNSTIRLNHGFSGAIRWYVTSWKRKGAAGPFALSEVELGGSRDGFLALYSQVPGRAVIRVESVSGGQKPDETTRTLVTPGGGSGLSEILFGAESTTTTTAWTRLGARKLDMSLYPTATSVIFKATLENTLTSASWYSEVRLFDITHNVAVTSTTMDNSAEADRSLAAELTSAALTVGSSSGNIRSDVATMYAVQFRATGTVTDTATQRAVIGNARLVIS